MAVRSVLLAVAALSVLHGASAEAPDADARVEVFTLSTLPLTNVRGASVYYLDGLTLLEQHLSANLPVDAPHAQALVSQRMQALGPQLQSRSRAAAEGLGRAAQLGLQRAPAIVFDGQWAVYGLTDVDAARRIFSSRRR
jgi:integrating conjugative element protein (TIGR03757 family)